MIGFRDFAPVRVEGGLLHADRYQTFDDAVAAANAWIEATGHEIVNVETVVMPNIWEKHDVNTHRAAASTAEGMTAENEWSQFVRVWYRG